MDPNIAKIIERTRARRAAGGGGGGETPLRLGGAERERSPLKPRNFEPLPASSGSPRKGTGVSPRKSEIPGSPSDTVKRLLAGDDIGSSVRELISR